MGKRGKEVGEGLGKSKGSWARVGGGKCKEEKKEKEERVERKMREERKRKKDAYVPYPPISLLGRKPTHTKKT